MREKVTLLVIAGAMALLLFGCSSTTGFSGLDVHVSGRYEVMSKSPGVLEGLRSIQVFQVGKSLEGQDNQGHTWTGTLGNWYYYGVIDTAAQQQQQQQATQQQQQELPDFYQTDIHMTSTWADGTKVTISGTIDSDVELAVPTTGQQQQQQVTGRNTTIIATVTVVSPDGTTNTGQITLYNPLTITQTQQQQTP
jgi:hypothetical protein